MRNYYPLNRIGLIYFVFFAAFGIHTAYLNVFLHSIQLSGIQIGSLNGLMILMGLFSAPLWGYFNDRYGKEHQFLSVTALGACVSILLLGLTRQPTTLFANAALYGFFFFPLMPLIDHANLSALENRRELYGRQRIWGSIGFIFAVILFGNWFEKTGLQWMFTFMAISFAMVSLLARRLPSQAPQLPAFGMLDSLHRLFFNPTWLFFTIGVFFYSLSNTGMNAFLGIWLGELGGSETLIGYSFGIGAAAELPIFYFSPMLLQRLGLYRMLVWAVLAFVVRLGLYAWMPSAEWALPIAILNSLTFGMFWVACVVFINQSAPRGFETTNQSLLLSTMSLASTVGSPLSGWIYDLIGGSFLFFVLAILVLMTLFWFWISRLTMSH